MKFVSGVLGDVDGIQNFYIVGMMIFLVLFVVILYRTIKMPKKDLIKFKTDILDDYENTNSNQE